MTNAIRTLELNLIDAINLDLSNYSESEDTQIRTRFGQTNITSFKTIQKDTLARWAVGRYGIEEAAEFISKFGDVDFDLILKKIVSAVKKHELNTYPTGQNIIRDIVKSEIWDEAYWDDLNKWIDANEKRITWRFKKPTEGTNQTLKAAKGLSKKTIMQIFDGLHFTSKQWGRSLADVPVWLEECLVTKGSKARRVSHTWNPVLIGIALIERHNVSMRKLDSIFIGLNDWKDEWQEKSEYYR